MDVVNPRPDGGQLLSQKEIAQVLGRSVKTVRRYTKKGIIPHFREDEHGWPVYPLPAVLRWMEETGRAA